MTKRNWIALSVILIVAFAARLGVWTLACSNGGAPYTPDSDGYTKLSESLLVRGEFSLRAWDTADRDGYDQVRSLAINRGENMVDWFREHQWFDLPQPEVSRTPGYPVFLFLGWALRPGATFPLEVVLVLQVLLDVTLVYLTYRLGRRMVGEGVGLGAAALQALSPVVIASSCRILSDSLYAFGLTAALLLIVGHIRTVRWGRLAWASVLLGLTCYVRPVAIIMAIIVVVVLLCRPKRFRRAGAFAGIFIACIAPWVVRNAVRADYYGFSSNGGDTMYYFYTPEILVRTRGIDGEISRAWVRLESAQQAVFFGLPVGQAARWRQRKAIERIREHPWLYARIHFKGCLGFWLPGATDVLEVTGTTRGNRNTLEVLRRQGLWAAVMHYFGGDWGALTAAVPMVLILLVKYGGVLACVVVGLRRRIGAEAWLLVAIVAVSMLLTGPFGLPRYRIPVEPILNVAAAVGLGAVFARRRRAPRQTEKPITGSRFPPSSR